MYRSLNLFVDWKHIEWRTQFILNRKNITYLYCNMVLSENNDYILIDWLDPYGFSAYFENNGQDKEMILRSGKVQEASLELVALYFF